MKKVFSILKNASLVLLLSQPLHAQSMEDLQASVESIKKMEEQLKVRSILLTLQYAFTQEWKEEKVETVTTSRAEKSISSFQVLKRTDTNFKNTNVARFSLNFNGANATSYSKTQAQQTTWDVRIPIVTTTETRETYDRSRFVFKNEKEWNDFLEKIKTDKELLNTYLREYLSINIESIIALKLMATEAAYQMVELSKRGIQVDPNLLASIQNAAHFVQFYAQQEITACVRKESIPTVSTREVETRIQSILISETVTTERQSTHRHGSTSVDCLSSLNTLTVNEHEPFVRVQLNKIDQILTSWLQAARRGILFNFTEKAPMPPQFNLKYLRDN